MFDCDALYSIVSYILCYLCHSLLALMTLSINNIQLIVSIVGRRFRRPRRIPPCQYFNINVNVNINIDINININVNIDVNINININVMSILMSMSQQCRRQQRIVATPADLSPDGPRGMCIIWPDAAGAPVAGRLEKGHAARERHPRGCAHGRHPARPPTLRTLRTRTRRHHRGPAT